MPLHPSAPGLRPEPGVADARSSRAPVRYAESVPPPALADRLACVWLRRAGWATSTAVVPDGCVDVMWIIDGGRSTLVVAGPDTRAHRADLGPGGSIAGVRFLPGAAADVLGVPLDAVRDERPLLADLWGGAEAERLAEIVEGADAPEAALVAAVAERGAVPTDPLARHVAEALATSLEPSPVRGLADALGLSERQLHRRCLAAFGYGPKTLHRVLRFQRALGRARAGDDLARIAHECGYADQAHLARDVASLGDTTMTALLAS